MRTRKTASRGMVTPSRVIGPDRSQRILVNETMETTASTAPSDSTRDWFTKVVMSCCTRWSGLSMVLSMNRDR
ncbi:Uncharacterised protein [Mycobacteroides abscessus subsp. abscessus]|nr:Uncharacterised protein [Mycobacteroides abscessus subsp. abscessus]